MNVVRDDRPFRIDDIPRRVTRDGTPSRSFDKWLDLALAKVSFIMHVDNEAKVSTTGTRAPFLRGRNHDILECSYFYWREEAAAYMVIVI
jgi:hypothetical protein